MCSGKAEFDGDIQEYFRQCNITELDMESNGVTRQAGHDDMSEIERAVTMLESMYGMMKKKQYCDENEFNKILDLMGYCHVNLKDEEKKKWDELYKAYKDYYHEPIRINPGSQQSGDMIKRKDGT
jgi:hypothetical protein